MFRVTDVVFEYRKQSFRVLLSDHFYGGAFVISSEFTGCIEDMPLNDAKRECCVYTRADRYGWPMKGMRSSAVLMG